jgi:hypothetical protein
VKTHRIVKRFEVLEHAQPGVGQVVERLVATPSTKRNNKQIALLGVMRAIVPDDDNHCQSMSCHAKRRQSVALLR